MAAKTRPGVEVRVAADGTKTYRVRWRPGGGRGSSMQSHTFSRVVAANGLHDELVVGGWICYCRKHAPEGEPVSPVPTGLRPSAGDRVVTPGPAGPLFGTYARRHATALTGVGEGYRADILRDLDRHMLVFADRPLEAITWLDVREWIRGFETGTHPWLHRKDCAWAIAWEAAKAKAPAGAPLADLLARILQAAGGVPACTKGCKATRAPQTVRRLLTEAGTVMAAAVKDVAVSRNVFREHRVGRTDEGHDQDHDQTFLTHAEWALLRSCLPEGTYRDLCEVLVGTGMRWSEATALAVGAVDVDAKPPRLHVARAWKRDGKTGFVLGTPKSARSRRTLTFGPAIREVLLRHVTDRDDDGLVFTTVRGRPVRHSNFYTKIWRPAVAKAQAAGLTKDPRIHDLRHTYVSWMIADGVPVAVISRRLGHSSITVTIDRYGHILPEADDAAVAAAEKALSAPEPADSDPESPE